MKFVRMGNNMFKRHEKTTTGGSEKNLKSRQETPELVNKAKQKTNIGGTVNVKKNVARQKDTVTDSISPLLSKALPAMKETHIHIKKAEKGGYVVNHHGVKNGQHFDKTHIAQSREHMGHVVREIATQGM